MADTRGKYSTADIDPVASPPPARGRYSTADIGVSDSIPGMERLGGSAPGPVALPPLRPVDARNPVQKTAGALWDWTGKPIMDIMGGASRDPERGRIALETAKRLGSGIVNEPLRIIGKEKDAIKDMVTAVRPGTRSEVRPKAFRSSLSNAIQAVPLFGPGIAQAGTEYSQDKPAEATGHVLAMLSPEIAREASPLAESGIGRLNDITPAEVAAATGRATTTGLKNTGKVIRGGSTGAWEAVPKAKTGVPAATLGALGYLYGGRQGALVGTAAGMVPSLIGGAWKGIKGEFTEPVMPRPNMPAPPVKFRPTPAEPAPPTYPVPKTTWRSWDTGEPPAPPPAPRPVKPPGVTWRTWDKEQPPKPTKPFPVPPVSWRKAPAESAEAASETAGGMPKDVTDAQVEAYLENLKRQQRPPREPGGKSGMPPGPEGEGTNPLVTPESERVIHPNPLETLKPKPPLETPEELAAGKAEKATGEGGPGGRLYSAHKSPREELTSMIHANAMEMEFPGSPAGQRFKWTPVAKEIYGVNSWGGLSEAQMSSLNEFFLEHKRPPTAADVTSGAFRKVK